MLRIAITITINPLSAMGAYTRLAKAIGVD